MTVYHTDTRQASNGSYTTVYDGSRVAGKVTRYKSGACICYHYESKPNHRVPPAWTFDHIPTLTEAVFLIQEHWDSLTERERISTITAHR